MLLSSGKKKRNPSEPKLLEACSICWIYEQPKGRILREENTKQGGEQCCFSSSSHYFFRRWMGVNAVQKELFENQNNAQPSPPRLKDFLSLFPQENQTDVPPLMETIFPSGYSQTWLGIQSQPSLKTNSKPPKKHNSVVELQGLTIY